MSLDVALDIIGTLRMMKIDEISEEKDDGKSSVSCPLKPSDSAPLC